MKYQIINLKLCTIKKLKMTIALFFAFVICNANTMGGEQQDPYLLCSDGTKIITDVPIDAIFFNECCDENIQLSGNALIVVNDNIIHLVVSNLIGTGLSTGYDYEGRGPSVETNVFYSNSFEGTLNFKLHMTNDDGCSFRLKATFHIEVNANGDVAVTFMSFETQCLP